MAMSPEEIQKIMEGPALQPPLGVRPNFDDPPDMNQLFTILLTTASVLVTPFVAVRLYTKWILRRKVLPEDVLLLLGTLLGGLGLNIVVFKTMPLHYGAHQWNIQYKNLIEYLKLAHTATLLFCVVMLLLRLTIILQIMRAFVPPRTRNFTFWAGIVLIIANTAFWACITFLEIFSCNPREKLWNPIVPGKCINRHAYQVASAVMNMSSEMLILLLPQRVIWNLSITRKQRMGLSALFLLGVLTVASSMLRLIYTVKLWPTDDGTYYIAKGVTLWTIPEITFCILVPCLPVIPQFFKMMKRKRSNGRPASSMFAIPGTPKRRPSRNRSFAFKEKHGIRKTTETVVTDIEYHELMNTNMSEHENMEHIAPWIREPGHAVIAPSKIGRSGTVSRMGHNTS